MHIADGRPGATQNKTTKHSDRDTVMPVLKALRGFLFNSTFTQYEEDLIEFNVIIFFNLIIVVLEQNNGSGSGTATSTVPTVLA